MSSDQSVQAIQAFHKNIVAFCDELIEMFPNESDFVVYRIMVKDRLPITEVIKHMSTYLLPEKEFIKSALKSATNGNIMPFNERINQLFAEFGGNNYNEAKNYKQLFDGMDNESKIAIWKWLLAFIHLIEKCQ
jgi:hypothetical protein